MVNHKEFSIIIVSLMVSILLIGSFGIVKSFGQIESDSKYAIPDWTRNIALWWSEDQIDDATFLSAMEYLVNQKIIVAPQLGPLIDYWPPSESPSESISQKPISDYYRKAAKQWIANEMEDFIYISHIQVLIFIKNN
ncbi:hypothetical protein [Nitrosarchaeum sp.]|uniref:hypothetical protein n=1 Tax=Nitrosarchaeum sp. TaxID=2026886 RepID=UPI00247CEE60|nr:hypothetical protein [Nitrosarchaeum sp.]MCV0412933.1 hypothetical protein [Nitrosarchaeum sp.]